MTMVVSCRNFEVLLETESRLVALGFMILVWHILVLWMGL